MLQIDNSIRDLIDLSEDFLKIKEIAIKRGMRTLRRSALRKLPEGATTFEEVVRVRGSSPSNRSNPLPPGAYALTYDLIV